jgi:hypothetical protein
MLKRVLISSVMIFSLGAVSLLVDGCKSSSNGPTGGGGGVGSVITVVGKVIGQNGQAVAGVPVLVSGKVSTNTDASGNFSIANVTTPYDINVVDATNKQALVYKGLTRTDPTLVFLGSSPGTSRHGTINGQIFGPGFNPNQGVNDVTRVVFASPETAGSVSTGVSGLFGPINLTWYGPTATTGTLYALQFTRDANSLPIASGYKGYGTRSGIAVNDGSTLTNQFDTLQAVATTQFTATVTVPAAYTLSSKSLLLRITQFAVINILNDVTNNAALSYYTPTIGGATLLLQVTAIKGPGNGTVYYKNGVATGATGVAVSIPAAPDLSLPVDAATGVDTTVTFSWTPMAGAVHLLIFSSAGNPGYLIITGGTSASIPNLKGLGLGLPSAQSYSWQVYGIGPFASADAAAGAAGFLGALSNPTMLTTDGFYGISTGRHFTSAP